MRRSIQHISISWLGGLAMAVALPPIAAHGLEQTNAPAKAPIPKSVFVDDGKSGRDPFFPSTARRAEKMPQTQTHSDTSQPSVPKVSFEQVRLKGILGNTARRLALINNHTFEVGEQAEVKTGDGKVRVRCLEIRDHSVIVTMAGENQRRELQLNEKL